jgi:hypothetical protein
MKKFLFSVLALCGFVFPLLAQVDHDYNPNDRVPLVNTTITQEQVPAAVLKAVNTQFDKNNVLTWSKFPFALKEYGWVYDAGASDIPLNRYEVTMRTNSGDELWAIYSPKGELVQTREVFKNAIVPQSVMQSLANSQYKDWKIVGDKEVIRFYHDHDNSTVEQHYRLTVEKDKVKRTISFNYQNKSNKT